MLNSKDFTTAIEIISKHHSTELAINTPINNFAGYIGYRAIQIQVTPKEMRTAVINSLIKEGFILSMGPEGLEVDKI